MSNNSYLILTVHTFDYTIDEEFGLMNKYELTPNQLEVLKTIMLLQEGYNNTYLLNLINLFKINSITFRDILVSLQNKGIILKSYKIPSEGSSFDPNDIPIAKNFIKSIWRSSFELGKELFETYPMFININGSLASARGIAKKFDSPEDFFRYYGKIIKWNINTHNKIIDLIKWEQENDIHFINMSLATFVINQNWNELEALKDGKLANINYNTIKSL